jgi:hypothetical protein
MFNFDQQMNQSKQQAAQAGFSGSAIIDAHPSTGIIRIKLTTSPPESLASFVTNYIQLLNMSLGAMNVETRVHIAEEEVTN